MSHARNLAQATIIAAKTHDDIEIRHFEIVLSKINKLDEDERDEILKMALLEVGRYAQL